MHKLMFDTSVFNFVHRHNLFSKIESFFTQNRDISIYICDTQEQELSAISDSLKRERIEKMMENIRVRILPFTSFGFVGFNENSPHNFGYRGARVGYTKVADIDQSKPNHTEKLIGSVDRNPLGDAADLTIIDTAITEEMDYLVTHDLEMKTCLPERLREVRIYPKKPPELKIELIKEKEDLMNFLNSL